MLYRQTAGNKNKRNLHRKYFVCSHRLLDYKNAKRYTIPQMQRKGFELAISVLFHFRPKFIKKIQHKNSNQLLTEKI